MMDQSDAGSVGIVRPPLTDRHHAKCIEKTIEISKYQCVAERQGHPSSRLINRAWSALNHRRLRLTQAVGVICDNQGCAACPRRLVHCLQEPVALRSIRVYRCGNNKAWFSRQVRNRSCPEDVN
eukprot:2346148-Pyramimonas_sp.AAC.1